MDNELPEDQTHADGREPLERPASKDRLGEIEPHSSAVSEQHTDVVREDLSEEVLTSETVPDEPDFVVVDPYIAAPPADLSGFGVHSDDTQGQGDAWQDHVTSEDPFIPLPYIPSTQGDSIRQSGLAWSAGIAFFGSVAFTLFLGWIADLLLGISPWGIIVGIIFGSIIGFMQFFRITSRIFPRRDDGPEISPLMSHRDDE